MSVYQPGRVLYETSYSMDGLAAGGAAETILDSDTIRGIVAGKVCHLRIVAKGGGLRKAYAATGVSDRPAMFRLKEYQDGVTSLPFMEMWPWPGSAVGKYVIPIHANHTQAIGGGSRWVLDAIAPYLGFDKTTAYQSNGEMYVQVVEGDCIPRESVSLNFCEDVTTTIVNERIWDASWRRASGNALSGANDVVACYAGHAASAAGNYVVNSTTFPCDYGQPIQLAASAAVESAPVNLVHAGTTLTANVPQDIRLIGSSGYCTAQGYTVAAETAHPYWACLEAQWIGGF